MKLRPYQAELVELIRAEYTNGHRKILGWLATGGGKSAITITMIKSMIDNGLKVCFVVRRKQLVVDTYKKFDRAGIPASIFMASHKLFDPGKALQVCSIDTVGRGADKASFLHDFDCVYIDEAHDSVSPSYRQFFSRFKTNTFFIGLTATPFKVSGKAQDFFDVCVKSVEVHELIDMKFLVKPKVYCPALLDLSEISISKSDFNQKELSELVTQSGIIGNVINSYKKFGEDKRAICFAVNKLHSKALCDAFNIAGIPAAHADESTPQEERDKHIDDLKKGIIKVLCNVNIFSTGVDIPQAEVGILARPTKSETLYIQQAGRVLRPCRICMDCKKQYDNSLKCCYCGSNRTQYIKEYAIIIDHGNNVFEHGAVDKVRTAHLKNEKRGKPLLGEDGRPIETEIKVKTCEVCFGCYLGHAKTCPLCGHENEAQIRVIKTVEGELVPYSEYAHLQVQLDLLKTKGELNRWKPKAWMFQAYKKFGDTLYKYDDLKFPKWIRSVYLKNEARK